MKIEKVYPAGWKFITDDETYYFGEYGQFGCYMNNGVVYKDRHAFETGEGVCYINEYGFEESDALDHLSDKQSLGAELVNNPYVAISGYTRQDLLDICCGNERLAEDLFDHLDWMAPEALFDEWERELFDEEEDEE